MKWYSQTIVGTCLYYKTSSLLISQPNRASVLNNPAVFCLYTGYERVLVFQERLIYPEKKKKGQNNTYFSKWEAIKNSFLKYSHISFFAQFLHLRLIWFIFNSTMTITCHCSSLQFISVQLSNILKKRKPKSYPGFLLSFPGSPFNFPSCFQANIDTIISHWFTVSIIKLFFFFFS